MDEGKIVTFMNDVSRLLGKLSERNKMQNELIEKNSDGIDTNRNDIKDLTGRIIAIATTISVVTAAIGIAVKFL